MKIIRPATIQDTTAMLEIYKPAVLESAISFETVVPSAAEFEKWLIVHPDFHGQGIGKEIYKELLALLKQNGIVNAVAVISLPNDPSVNFHESLGFKKTGHFKNIGFKFGHWWDVGYWQLEFDKLANFSGHLSENGA
jgi:L-amino acid N-acyltransferase YncA